MSGRVVLGVSGASGAVLGLECARLLRGLGCTVALVLSPQAERSAEIEIGAEGLQALYSLADEHYAPQDMAARIASGSVQSAGMIVAPCSMRSLAAIAHGLDDTLLTRAASVMLKERRRLVLLTREAPLTLAHLRNMVAATEMGAVILPPVPAFYLRPQSCAELTAQIAARAVDLLALAPAQARAWAPV